MSRPLVLACSVAVLCVTANAHADSTTTPHPGVTHQAHDGDGQRWHMITIDLARPSLRMKVSTEASRGKVVSAIGKIEGAVIAANAGFFRPDYSLCGISMSNGAPWSKVDDTTCIHGLGWGEGASSWQLLSTKMLAKGPFPAGVTDVVSGYPTLVKGGVLCDGASAATCTLPSGASESFKSNNPRTLLGVDQKRTKAVLAVIDGRDGAAARGLTLVESMTFARDVMGAWDAVNLDGGGSTTLWIAGEGGVQNKPSDGSERVVSNAVLLMLDPTKEGGDASASDPVPTPASTPWRSSWRHHSVWILGVIVVSGLVLLSWRRRRSR